MKPTKATIKDCPEARTSLARLAVRSIEPRGEMKRHSLDATGAGPTFSMAQKNGAIVRDGPEFYPGQTWSPHNAGQTFELRGLRLCGYISAARKYPNPIVSAARLFQHCFPIDDRGHV